MSTGIGSRMASSGEPGDPPRRSARSTKGVPPVRFRMPNSEQESLGSRSSDSASVISSASAASSSSRKRRAKLDAAVQMAKLEQRQIEQQKRIVQLELEAALAEIDEDASDDDSTSISQEASSFQTCAQEVDVYGSGASFASLELEGEKKNDKQDEESDSAPKPESEVRDVGARECAGECGELDKSCGGAGADLTKEAPPRATENVTQREAREVVREWTASQGERDRRGNPLRAAEQGQAQRDTTVASALALRPLADTFTPKSEVPLERKWRSATTAGRSAAEVENWLDSVPPFYPPPAVGQHHIKPLDLPKFSGEQRAYVRWRQRFLRLIDDDRTTSEEYKLARLREAMEGALLRS